MFSCLFFINVNKCPTGFDLKTLWIIILCRKAAESCVIPYILTNTDLSTASENATVAARSYYNATSTSAAKQIKPRAGGVDTVSEPITIPAAVWNGSKIKHLRDWKYMWILSRCTRHRRSTNDLHSPSVASSCVSTAPSAGADAHWVIWPSDAWSRAVLRLFVPESVRRSRVCVRRYVKCLRV